jgi:cell division protein YceG involved in septum cleavage
MRKLSIIMSEFQIAETLYRRGYITPDTYEKYKKDTANELLQFAKEKQPWWRGWHW